MRILTAGRAMAPGTVEAPPVEAPSASRWTLAARHTRPHVRVQEQHGLLAHLPVRGVDDVARVRNG